MDRLLHFDAKIVDGSLFVQESVSPARVMQPKVTKKTFPSCRLNIMNSPDGFFGTSQIKESVATVAKAYIEALCEEGIASELITEDWILLLRIEGFEQTGGAYKVAFSQIGDLNEDEKADRLTNNIQDAIHSHSSDDTVTVSFTLAAEMFVRLGFDLVKVYEASCFVSKQSEAGRFYMAAQLDTEDSITSLIGEHIECFGGFDFVQSSFWVADKTDQFLLHGAAADFSRSALAPYTPKISDELLGGGVSSGVSRSSGAPAFNLEQARRLGADGHRVILCIDDLAPADASILSQISGLVIRNAGPASHICVMSRAIGVPTLTQFSNSEVFVSLIGSGSFGPESAAFILLDEVSGKLYMVDQEPTLSCELSLQNVVLSSRVLGLQNSKIADPDSGAPIPIGLFRSETKVIAKGLGMAVTNFIRKWLDHGEVGKLQQVIDQMRVDLNDVLVQAAGSMVNYRLIDFRTSEITHEEDLPIVDIRGPQWAIPSGFYKAQIDMAISTAMLVGKSAIVDLVITVPSAFSRQEVEYVRNLIEKKREEYPLSPHINLRFGVMIENSRALAMASSFGQLADVICFGLNDLTSTSIGLARESWPAIRQSYIRGGLVGMDYFVDTDEIYLQNYLEAAVERLNAGFGEMPIIFCGALSANPALIQRFIDFPNVSFCVEDGQAEAVSRQIDFGARNRACLPLKASVFDVSEIVLERILRSIECNEEYLGKKCVSQWANELSRGIGIKSSSNWKTTKRLLVETLFGELEGKYFFYPHDHEEMLEVTRIYAASDAVVRASIFPDEISCHSSSTVLDSSFTDADLRSLFSEFDAKAVVHIFPQQSSDQLAFRMLVAQDSVTIEAGIGEATKLFEEERGVHPLMTAKGGISDPLKIIRSDQGVSKELEVAFHELLERQRGWIFASAAIVSQVLGCHKFALECYFNPNTGGAPVVVDMDLPFDIVWN